MRENQLEQELSDQLDRLRARIAAAPPRSFTAGQARKLIDHVTAPECPLDLQGKLAAVMEEHRTFRDGVMYSDPIRHGPDTWKRDPEPIRGGDDGP